MTTVDGIYLSDELKAELNELQRDNWSGQVLINSIDKSLDKVILEPKGNEKQEFETVQVLWQCRKLIRMIIEAKEKDNE